MTAGEPTAPPAGTHTAQGGRERRRAKAVSVPTCCPAQRILLLLTREVRDPSPGLATQYPDRWQSSCEKGENKVGRGNANSSWRKALWPPLYRSSHLPGPVHDWLYEPINSLFSLKFMQVCFLQLKEVQTNVDFLCRERGTSLSTFLCVKLWTNLMQLLDFASKMSISVLIFITCSWQYQSLPRSSS